MSEAKQKLILLAVPLSLSFTWNAFPANSKPRMSSCVSEPCKLNPCPTVCYVLVLTKGQGKEAWALPKKRAKAVDDYLAKGDCLEDIFSTNAQELSTLCIYPKNFWTTQRMCQSTKHCLSQLMPKIFHPATYEEHPINNHDPDRVPFWKSCHEWILGYGKKLRISWVEWDAVGKTLPGTTLPKRIL